MTGKAVTNLQRRKKMQYKTPGFQCIGAVADITQSGSVTEYEELMTGDGAGDSGFRYCGSSTIRMTCAIP